MTYEDLLENEGGREIWFDAWISFLETSDRITKAEKLKLAQGLRALKKVIK